MSKLNPYAILYVDDEGMALKYFEKGFSQDFEILTASSAAAGWEIIQQRGSHIGVLMTDQRMPGQTGVQLLEKVRQDYPQIIRILVTAYSDIDSAIAGVNNGAIYRYISKPWEVPELRITLLRALEYFSVLKERDELVQQKLSILQQIVLSDRTKNFGILAAGLGCHFRNALRAASHFIAAVPQVSLESAALGFGKAAIGRNIEHLIKKAADHVFHVASAMKQVQSDSASASFKSTPLQTLLTSLPGQASWPAAASITVQVNPALPPVQVNQPQIAKLFTTLISNLLAVSEQGGAVRIEAKETIEEKGSRFVRIEISQDGPEWRPEQRIRFFAPFSSAREEAHRLGLDLAVCYFIVHHHGGRITVAAQAQSRVVIDLPLTAPDEDQAPREQVYLDQLFHYERALDEFLISQK
jgi:two-component system probable response regulator PhcQ